MSNRFGRGAGLDAFARCPTPGCETRVYAPLMIPTRCEPHGGEPSLPQIPGDDEYGIPRTAARGRSLHAHGAARSPEGA